LRSCSQNESSEPKRWLPPPGFYSILRDVIALVFGEELGLFVRRALLLVIAIAFLVLGNNFLTALGLTGAVL
jgi:hypothetical protein